MTLLAPCDVIQLGEDAPRTRVLWIDIDKGGIVLIDIDADRALPTTRQINEIDALLEAGFARHVEDPWLRPYADDDLPEKWRKRRDAAWALIQPLVRAQPDTFLEAPRAKLIAEIVAQGSSNRFTLYRHLRRYWQRGMTPNALLPDYSNSGGPGKSKGASGKKRGRPPIHGIEGMNVTPEVRDCFRSSVQRYYAKENKLLPSDCYRRCLRDFFSEPVVNPETGAQEFVIRPNHPTLAQFRYWLERDNDILDLDRKQRTPRVYEKDRRGLLGTSRQEVNGPGDRYQIDATIADIYLVSRFDRQRIVGRPTIDVIVDVFSSLIVGLYVGWEHPSWLGAMMALINAASDKVSWCREIGIEIDEADWPCASLPRTLLGDRGEMMGKKAEVLVKNFGVHLENSAPYRPDWKGIVEKQFDLLPAIFKAYAPGYVAPDFKERGAHD